MIETLGDIAAQFPRAQRSTETGEPGSSAHDVSSGGVKARARDPEPALYLTSDAAIAAWRDHVLALLTAEKATGFSVIDGPHLDKWRITVADGGYTHRIAEDRYSVTARIGVIREKPMDVDRLRREVGIPDSYTIEQTVNENFKVTDPVSGREFLITKEQVLDNLYIKVGKESLGLLEMSKAIEPALPKPKPAKAAKKQVA